MDPKKKTPDNTATPNPDVTPQPTDDVVLEVPPVTVTVDDDGKVDAAAAGAQALPTQSLPDAFSGGAAAITGNMTGGSPWMPKDAAAFSRGFQIVVGVLSLFVGFRAFMTAVKRPQDAALVPPAATAVSQYWLLLNRMMPGALSDINIGTIRALLARLLFVQTLLKYSGTLNTRLLAVQSHLEDQLTTQMRPIFKRCETLLTTHDDLVDPLEPLVLLYAASGQKSAEARRNNQKVGEAAVAKAKANETPGEGIPSVPPGTTPTGATTTTTTVAAPPASAVPPVAVTPPVKAPAPTPPAAKKSRSRG